MKGLKIRTPNIPVMRDAVAAWGVSVTTMDPSELYSALQTGVVDGQENPPSSIYGWKLYEVQKYLMLTGHMMGNMAVMINDKAFQKLSPDQQKALQEAVREAGDFQSALTVNRDKENIEKLRQGGMTVIQPQVDAFRKLSASIIPQYEPKWGVGLYKKIQDIK
jgi:TRAP-type C4-dicarboxylate transport system substrate-binding protein